MDNGMKKTAIPNDREWLMMDEHYTPETTCCILMHRLSSFDIRFSKVPTLNICFEGDFKERNTRVDKE